MRAEIDFFMVGWVTTNRIYELVGNVG